MIYRLHAIDLLSLHYNNAPPSLYNPMSHSVWDLEPGGVQQRLPGLTVIPLIIIIIISSSSIATEGRYFV